MVLPITNLILHFFDILLTHYQLFMDKKKNVLDMKKERNWLPRLLMGNNPNPKSFIFGFVVTGSMIFFASVYFNSDIVFGMMILVVYIHYLNISDYRKLWNNKYYWNNKLKLFKYFKRKGKCVSK